MTDLATQLDAIEQAFGQATEDRQDSAIETLVARFDEDWVRDSDLAQRVHDELMVRIAAGAPPKTRVRLAETLADVRAGPRQTVANLALDPTIEVARPVLERSPLLGEADLLNVVSAGAVDHLQAVAGRQYLAEAVADLLVARNVPPVLVTLAGNPTARLSRTGMTALVRIAGMLEDESLSDALADRGDLPTNLLIRLASQKRPAKPAPAAAPPATAADQVAAVAAKRSLREADVAALVGQGKWDAAVIVLAHLARQPPSIVGPAMNAPSLDPALVAMRLGGLSWRTAEAVLQHRAAALGQKPSMDELKGLYKRLTRANAELALQAFQMRAAA